MWFFRVLILNIFRWNYYSIHLKADFSLSLLRHNHSIFSTWCFKNWKLFHLILSGISVRSLSWFPTCIYRFVLSSVLEDNPPYVCEVFPLLYCGLWTPESKVSLLNSDWCLEVFLDSPSLLPAWDFLFTVSLDSHVAHVICLPSLIGDCLMSSVLRSTFINFFFQENLWTPPPWKQIPWKN